MSNNAIIKGCGFHHIAVQTTDYEGTKEFYTQVMGFRLVNEWSSDVRRLCLLDLGDGGCVEVIGAPPATDGEEAAKQHPMIHFAMRVDNVDAAIDRVRAAGRPVTIEPKDVTLGDKPARLAFFLGPNGEVLELFQEKA